MFLHRRLLLGNNHRLERLAEGLRDLARALDIVLPAEHLVDDVHVAEQIGDDPVVRLALDVVEEDRASAIHVLLQPGHLEIRIDRLVGFDQIALRLQPFERFPKIDYIRGVRKRLFFTDCFLHGVQAPMFQGRA